MRDPGTWSSDRFDGPRPPGHDAWVAELAASEPGIRELLELTPHALVGLDPPDHGRLRTVLRRAFAPGAVEALRPLLAAEIDDLLPSLVTGEPVDVAAAFSRPLPFRVVARLLGLPRGDWDALAGLAHAASTDDTAAEDRAALRARLLAERDMLRFFLEHLETPGAGLLETLREAIADGSITPREAAGLCREVLVAGSESVGHLLAGALFAIAEDGAPEDLGAFVEHRLAVDPPFAAFWRRATRPVTLAGVQIPAGGLVQLPYAQLNRDAARHLSFGHGLHFCLGAALARLEAQSALRAVLDATTAVEPCGPDHLVLRPIPRMSQIASGRRLVGDSDRKDMR